MCSYCPRCRIPAKGPWLRYRLLHSGPALALIQLGRRLEEKTYQLVIVIEGTFMLTAKSRWVVAVEEAVEDGDGKVWGERSGCFCQKLCLVTEKLEKIFGLLNRTVSNQFTCKGKAGLLVAYA